MIFSCGSSQETEISEFVDQPVNIDTKKNPIDRGNPIYKACYGLGTIFRTSSIRKSSIFGNRN